MREGRTERAGRRLTLAAAPTATQQIDPEPRLEVFPVPAALAEALSFIVFEVPTLPGGADQLSDGRVLWIAWDHDQRTRGTRLFRAIAVTLLGQRGASRSEAAAYDLAGRLAAPPDLMVRLGLEETIRRQTWATEHFLRWWWHRQG